MVSLDLEAVRAILHQSKGYNAMAQCEKEIELAKKILEAERRMLDTSASERRLANCYIARLKLFMPFMDGDSLVRAKRTLAFWEGIKNAG